MASQKNFFPLLLVAVLLSFSTSALSVGVNYGALADNLPPPPQVAEFLKTRTFIDRVKLFDCNPVFIRAFAGTSISVAVTAPNGEIPALSKLDGARSWVQSNVLPFVPASNITLVFIGNEIMASGDRNLIARLVPAMRSVKAALDEAGHRQIRVSTPHALGILSSSEPPSSAHFRRGYDKAIFTPMLQFHRDTRTPFVVNPYPYFGYNGDTVNYATFRTNPGMHDPVTKITYTNMFEAQMDAVYTAMNKIGFGDVEIVVGETGWPSQAEPGQAGVSPADAASYNGNLIRLVDSGRGTPLMPNRRFETYLFALFDENQKPGPIAERSWGLFRPDFTPVYDAGVLRGGQAVNPMPVPAPATGSGGKWCVPRPNVSPAQLQLNIDYICSTGLVDCKQIQNGGSCFEPNTLQNHAAYAMNAYYQAAGRNPYDCDFAQTGVLTTSDPSFGACNYAST